MWNKITLDIFEKQNQKPNTHIHEARSLSMKIVCAHFQRPIKYSGILPLCELLPQIPPKCI